jgi:hypothetical protein
VPNVCKLKMVVVNSHCLFSRIALSRILLNPVNRICEGRRCNSTSVSSDGEGAVFVTSFTLI